VWPPLPCRD